MQQIINRRLLEDRSLWQNINQQTVLFLELFTEISNNYPQNHLLRKFPTAKGCKVTKGLQLHGYPYQVLDIIRDFDQTKGFNIRILNWWGNGLFIVLLGGTDVAAQIVQASISHLRDYRISYHPAIWDYEKILWMPTEEKQQVQNTKSSTRIQLFKKIELLENPLELKTALLKEIDRILEYPW
jgi:hypothetical protein